MNAAGHTETLRFDAAVYNLDTVKKAVYRFSDVFSVGICLEGPIIALTLYFPPSAGPREVSGSIERLRKELLDQDLRRSVSEQTASYRNAILALAFASTTLPAGDG